MGLSVPRWNIKLKGSYEKEGSCDYEQTIWNSSKTVLRKFSCASLYTDCQGDNGLPKNNGGQGCGVGPAEAPVTNRRTMWPLVRVKGLWSQVEQSKGTSPYTSDDWGTLANSSENLGILDTKMTGLNRFWCLLINQTPERDNSVWHYICMACECLWYTEGKETEAEMGI